MWLPKFFLRDLTRDKSQFKLLYIVECQKIGHFWLKVYSIEKKTLSIILNWTHKRIMAGVHGLSMLLLNNSFHQNHQ